MMASGSGPVGGRSISGGMAARHRGPATPPGAQSPGGDRSGKQALAQAEALFKGKRARPEYQIDLKKLEAGHGSEEISRFWRKSFWRSTGCRKSGAS